MSGVGWGLCGSYEEADVRFLLKPLDLAPTPVETKERLIQSGQAHYSELLAPEHAPSPDYLERFHTAFELHGPRLARDVAALALALAESPEPIVLVSLARAGTPIGVSLRRALRTLGQDVPHYAISIIRDRGIDGVALDAIRAAHPGRRLWFIDGWTGKGAIRRELDQALAHYAVDRQVSLPPRLAVVADLAGVADLAASADDYVIPSSILNGIVSGLVSRTVLPRDHPRDQPHGCVVFEHLAAHDVSRWYVDQIEPMVTAALPDAVPARWSDADRAQRRHVAAAFIGALLAELGVEDTNRLKPGIGEATRAVLRRVPARVFVREPGAPDVLHLERLAAAKGVAVEARPDMPYRAVTLIQALGGRHRPWRNPTGDET